MTSTDTAPRRALAALLLILAGLAAATGSGAGAAEQSLPIKLLDAAGEDVVGGETMRLFLGEANVAPDDEGRRATRLEMLLDKRPRGNAVAVGKDQVGPATSNDRPVESARLSKAVVGLPDVGHRHAEEPGVSLDDLTRLRAGAVIRDDQLEVTRRLTRVANQRQVQQLGLVEGRKQYARTWAHGRLGYR